MSKKASQGKYSTSQLVQSLLKKGFRGPVKGRDKHLFYLYYYNDKKTPIKTWVGKSEKGFDDHLLDCRKNQMKLYTKKNFILFYSCPMTHQGYEKYLIGNKYMKCCKAPPT